MKKIKHLAIFLLMITFITLLSTKAKAAEVEEDKQYTLSQTITTKTLTIFNEETAKLAKKLPPRVDMYR